MAVHIIIVGVLGRMGREIARAALADREVRLVGCIEAPDNPCVGQPLGLHLGIDGCDAVIGASIDAYPVETSVIIDFTTPSSTCGLLDALGGRAARIVIGTTGMTAAQNERIRDSAKQSAVLLSPNMSLGVNLLFHLTKAAVERLGAGFDIEIIEAHHRTKKDSPSGTAKRLGEIAAAARGLSYDEAVRNGREGILGERPADEIGMHAVRGGDIAGEHTVLLAGQGERLELRHVAQGREALARGTIAAAKWLSVRPAGMYSMSDVLGL